MDQRTYRTPDLNVSAWLVVKGHKLLGIEPGPPSVRGAPRSFFVFPSTAAQDVSAYHEGGTCVARDLAESIRFLKDSLYETTRAQMKNGESNDRPRRQQ